MFFTVAGRRCVKRCWNAKLEDAADRLVNVSLELWWHGAACSIVLRDG